MSLHYTVRLVKRSSGTLPDLLSVDSLCVWYIVCECTCMTIPDFLLEVEKMNIRVN
jgi:hypothetical protein